MMKYLFLLFLFCNTLCMNSRKIAGRFSKFIGTNVANKIRGNYPQELVINNMNDEVIKEVDFYEKLKLNSSKLITITPGGFKGFYTLGVSKYIKDNYNVSDYIFSGASAGAWNALYMCKKKSEDDFISTMLGIDYDKINTLYDLQQILKHEIIKKYNNEDFDFDRLYIGVTIIGKCKLTTTIYTSFETLDDAIDCCIASSHIPFISGKVFHKYKNKLVLDGGFGDYPYIKIGPPIMQISPDIWGKSGASFMDLNDLNMKQENKNEKLKSLFEEGYLDTELNKDSIKLDDIE